MGEHVPDRTGPLALEGGEHVVEFEGTREEAEEGLADLGVGNVADRLSEQAETEQLAVVEHLVPAGVAVAEGLLRVVPRRDEDAG